jgi:hypothetical protein
MMIRAALLSSAVLVAAPAFAQAPTPAATPAPAKPAAAPASEAAAAPPKPAPDLEAAFKFFDGAWKCDTHFAANAFGPGSPEMSTKSTVKFKRDYDGYFYRGDYEIKKSKGMPGFRGTLFLSYQPAAKVFTLSGVDTAGSAEMATSPGFEGDTITFTGSTYAGGQAVKVRETMTKRGAKEAGHKLELDMGKGPMLIGEDTCKR